MWRQSISNEKIVTSQVYYYLLLISREMGLYFALLLNWIDGTMFGFLEFDSGIQFLHIPVIQFCFYKYAHMCVTTWLGSLSYVRHSFLF